MVGSKLRMGLIVVAGLFFQHDGGDRQILLKVNRYLGFRQATDVTWDSDYSFTLHTDGTWEYESTLGNAMIAGRVNGEMAGVKSELVEMLNNAKGASGPLAQIADAPAMRVGWTEKGNLHGTKLLPNSDVATKLHRKIHQWVAQDDDRLFMRSFVAPANLAHTRGRRFADPISIRSAEQLARHVQDDEVRAEIEEFVDFHKAVVLYFAWSGSGGDRLAGRLISGEPPRIELRYSPGATDDLSAHVKIFAVPKGVDWSLSR